MTWGKVDDGLHSHIKAIRAGLEAMGLWVLCMSYCGFHENDGVIEREVVWLKAGGEENGDRLAGRLVTAGLWESHREGWSFHDWSDYNPTAKELAADRHKAIERAKRGGEANRLRLLNMVGNHSGKGQLRPERQDTVTVAGKLHSSSGASELPSRPVPSRPKETKEANTVSRDDNSPKRKAAMLPESWRPSESTLRWAREKGVDPEPEVEPFLNHWTNLEDNTKARKVDWDKTFKNRILDQMKRGYAVMLPDAHKSALMPLDGPILPRRSMAALSLFKPQPSEREP